MGFQRPAVPTPGWILFEKSVNVLGKEDLAGRNSSPTEMLVKMRDVRKMLADNRPTEAVRQQPGAETVQKRPHGTASQLLECLRTRKGLFQSHDNLLSLPPLSRHSGIVLEQNYVEQ
jgi:hypothetical protein